MNIGPRLLALLTCLTGTVAFGQQPPIVFQENFDEPGWPDAEKWGETSAVLRGTQNETQAARVVNENSAEFGFDGNYLQLFKETTASASVWVVAQNKIPGSEVMTAEFDYRRMGPASDGPFLRFGINDPIASTGSRVTSELRFIDTGFSGVPNLVKDNETHRITWVYNNSTEPVTYADGLRTLSSERYDVWIDGRLVLRDHQFDHRDTSKRAGTPITSIGLGLFGAASGDFRMDNLTVYGGAWVADPDPTVYPVFADDFSTPVNGKPSQSIWKSGVANDSPPARVIEVANLDSETYFGEAANNYMRIFNDGVPAPSPEANHNVNIIARNVFFSDIITINFDFFEPVGVGSANLVLRPGRGVVGNPDRIHEITLGEGSISGVSGLYQKGEKNNIQIVMNNSVNAVTYLNGAEQVATDTYDVWLNGELVLSDHQYQHGGTLLPGSLLTAFQFVIWGGGSNEFLIDNLKVYDHAYIVPGPVSGITFAEWAEANLPEGARGPEDDAAGNGIPNLVTFALGLDPLAAGRDDLPVVSTTAEGGESFLSLTFQRFTGAVGVDIAVEVSENLVDWTPLTQEVEIVENRGENLELVRLIDSETISGSNRRFLRLSITQN